jgi:hypothetical protein
MTSAQNPHDESSPNSERGRRTPPKNHLLDEVRNRWEKDLAKAYLPPRPRTSNSESTTASSESTPSQPLEFSELPARKRNRILDLLDTRAQIEDLATTQEQRTAFSEWVLAEAQRRPNQTISGRIDDPRILPRIVPVSLARRTPLYEFEVAREIGLQRASSVQVAVDGALHPALVHSITPGRVILAFADLNRRTIPDAALVRENSIQLGEGTRVTKRYRYVFAMPDVVPFKPGSFVDFRDKELRIRGLVVDCRGKTTVVETYEKLPFHAKSGTLHEVLYWEDYYTRVRELRHMRFGRKFSHTTINELWEGFPDSKAGKFMRAVSRPMDYAFPHLDAQGELPAFFTRAFFDHCSLLPYLVSADLLPSKLLSDVKLIVWPHERLTAQRVLEMKSNPRVINGFKKMFEDARWLCPGERRILVLGPPQESTRRTYLQAPDIDRSLIGSFLYLREKVSGGLPKGKTTEFNPEPITIQFFPTVYEAYRRNPHASEQYEKELSQQIEFYTEVQDINQRITLYWQVDQGTKDALTEELYSFAARWSDTFANAEHRLKQELRDLLQDITDRIPNIKRRIGPIQTKLVASGNRAAGRSEELPDIRATMTTDEELLKGVIQHGEKQIALIRKRIVEAAPIFEQHEAQLFTPGRSEADQRAVVHGFLAKARLNLSALNGIRCRPFTVFADKLRENFANFQQALLKCDKESAYDSLVKLLVVTKLAHTNSIFEDLKFRVSFDATVTFAQLLKAATDLQKLVTERSVLPNRSVESYRAAYEQTESEVADLVREFEHYLAGGLDLEARKNTYQRIRKLLDQIDIESRIRTL